MYHLNTMVVEDLFSRRDTDLMARQQLAIATEGHVSTVARIRFTIGTKIVALGERIRPEAPVGDPRFNA